MPFVLIVGRRNRSVGKRGPLLARILTLWEVMGTVRKNVDTLWTNGSKLLNNGLGNRDLPSFCSSFVGACFLEWISFLEYDGNERVRIGARCIVGPIGIGFGGIPLGYERV